MKNLANLIDAWVEDYSAEDFMDDFLQNMTFGELVEAAYEAGVVSDSQIEEFLGD